MDKEKAEELGLQPVLAYVEKPEVKRDREAEKKRLNAERQARHRERLAAQGIEKVLLSAEDRRALEIGRQMLAAPPAEPASVVAAPVVPTVTQAAPPPVSAPVAVTPAVTPAPAAAVAPTAPAISPADRAALELGRKVQCLDGWRALLARIALR